MGETAGVIEIENVRNVRRLEVIVKPGLQVLCGDIGSGKSNALEAIRHHIEGPGSKANLEPHDDASMGSVAGFGGVMRVAARTTRTGELQVTTMAGKNLERLVDPHIIDEFSADAERAKAVCEMIRLKPSIVPFEDLLGSPEKLREIANPKSLSLDSVPDMAAAIKRDVEKVAQKLEGESKNEAGRAAGLRESLSGKDMTGPHDERELSQASDDAVRKLATLEAEERAARNAKASGDAARKTLDATPAPEPEEEVAARLARADDGIELARTALEQAKDPDAPFLGAHIAAIDHAMKGVETTLEQVNEARRALLVAEGAHREAVTARQNADSAYNAARMAEVAAKEGLLREAQGARQAAAEAVEAARRARIARAAAEEAVARASQAPDPDVLAQQVREAGVELIEAGKRRDQGAVIRSLLSSLKAADDASKRADALRNEAKAYRDIAAACEDVVTKAIRTVAPRGMSMRKGRLVVQTERGETLFAELSKGERTMIGLDIEIDALDAVTPAEEGTWRVLVLAQELFEGLPPSSCAAVDAKLKERNVAGITAKATEGELRAEPYATTTTP